VTGTAAQTQSRIDARLDGPADGGEQERDEGE